MTDIITAIDNKSFSQAVMLIDEFIKQNQKLKVYDDVNITALKLEIRYLEYQVISYDNEKAQIEKLLNDFHHQFIVTLDWYIKRALQLRKRIHELDKDKYKESKQDEQEYFEQAQTQIDRKVQKLSDDDEKSLKANYKKPCKFATPTESVMI